MSKKQEYIAVTIGVCLGFPFMFFNETFGIIAVLVFCGVALFLTSYFCEKAEAKRKQYILFDGETATLLKRGEEAVKTLFVEALDEVDYVFKPSELVYTGASVGGVSMGGFHTTEAHYQEKSLGATDRASIFCRYTDGNKIIKKIKLATPELVESAKENPKIKKFVKRNSLVLEYNTKDTKLTESEQYVLQRAIEEGNQALQYGVTQRAFIAKHLKKAECYDVINWLSGQI